MALSWFLSIVKRPKVINFEITSLILKNKEPLVIDPRAFETTFFNTLLNIIVLWII